MCEEEGVPVRELEGVPDKEAEAVCVMELEPVAVPDDVSVGVLLAGELNTSSSSTQIQPLPMPNVNTRIRVATIGCVKSNTWRRMAFVYCVPASPDVGGWYSTRASVTQPVEGSPSVTSDGVEAIVVYCQM